MSEHHVLRTLAELEQITDEWSNAAGEDANPLFGPEWTLACARAMPDPPIVGVIRWASPVDLAYVLRVVSWRMPARVTR